MAKKGRPRRHGDVIWIEITGNFCAEGIDAWWHYNPRLDDTGVPNTNEWFCLHRRPHPQSYEWKWERGSSVNGGVYIRKPGADDSSWQWVLDAHHLREVGPYNFDVLERTHPYVTFVWQEEEKR